MIELVIEDEVRNLKLDGITFCTVGYGQIVIGLFGDEVIFIVVNQRKSTALSLDNGCKAWCTYSCSYPPLIYIRLLVDCDTVSLIAESNYILSLESSDQFDVTKIPYIVTVFNSLDYRLELINSHQYCCEECGLQIRIGERAKPKISSLIRQKNY